MYKSVLGVILASMVTGGCWVTAGTYALEDAMLYHNALKEYLIENKEDRKRIRQLCRMVLATQAQTLMSQGKTQEARMLLSNAYPPVMTFEILDSGKEALNTAHMCE